MPPKHKQLTVYPDPTARAIVGGNTPACNRAIECWANVLRRSMPDLSREEWCFLADVLNGTWLLDASVWNASYLVIEAQDAQELNGTGDKWFGEELQRGSGQVATEALIAKLQSMNWEQAQYVLTAIEFFWGDHEEIDFLKEEWWTIPFRVQRLSSAEESAKKG